MNDCRVAFSLLFSKDQHRSVPNLMKVFKQTVKTMIRRHIRRLLPFFVAFPWVETSTGPGGFMICVFII